MRDEMEEQLEYTYYNKRTQSSIRTAAANHLAELKSFDSLEKIFLNCCVGQISSPKDISTLHDALKKFQVADSKKFFGSLLDFFQKKEKEILANKQIVSLIFYYNSSNLIDFSLIIHHLPTATAQSLLYFYFKLDPSILDSKLVDLSKHTHWDCIADTIIKYISEELIKPYKFYQPSLFEEGIIKKFSEISLLHPENSKIKKLVDRLRSDAREVEEVECKKNLSEAYAFINAVEQLAALGAVESLPLIFEKMSSAKINQKDVQIFIDHLILFKNKDIKSFLYFLNNEMQKSTSDEKILQMRELILDKCLEANDLEKMITYELSQEDMIRSVLEKDNLKDTGIDICYKYIKDPKGIEKIKQNLVKALEKMGVFIYGNLTSSVSAKEPKEEIKFNPDKVAIANVKAIQKNFNIILNTMVGTAGGGNYLIINFGFFVSYIDAVVKKLKYREYVRIPFKYNGYLHYASEKSGHSEAAFFEALDNKSLPRIIDKIPYYLAKRLRTQIQNFEIKKINAVIIEMFSSCQSCDTCHTLDIEKFLENKESPVRKLLNETISKKYPIPKRKESFLNSKEGIDKGVAVTLMFLFNCHMVSNSHNKYTKHLLFEDKRQPRIAYWSNGFFCQKYIRPPSDDDLREERLDSEHTFFLSTK